MSYGAIARGVAKGIQKAIKTPGRKTIGGVKVKKIPTGKRSRSEKEMQRIAREDVGPHAASPQWPKRGVVTKGSRRKSGETGLAAPVDVKKLSKAQTQAQIKQLRGERKVAESSFKRKKPHRLKLIAKDIKNYEKKVKTLSSRLKLLKQHEGSKKDILKLQNRIKGYKQDIRMAKAEARILRRKGADVSSKLAKQIRYKIKNRPKINVATGGKIVKRKAGGQIGTGAALRGFGKGYKT